MSTYNKKDMQLLQEAYAVTLLREQISYMTLDDLKSRLPLMTESELKFVNEGLKNLLEFWGGLKNLGKSVGKGMANAFGDVGRGALAAGKQMASNVGNIYHSGEKTSALNAASEKANELIDELLQLTAKYEPGATKQDIMSYSLEDILQILQKTTQDTKQNTPGFTSGIGQAARKGFSTRKTPPPLPAQPPPLPTKSPSAKKRVRRTAKPTP